MVQGPRTKIRKSPSVQLDYLLHIQEIKPWPPTQSLRTLRAVLIQWEHGERNSGLTKQVVPSLGTGSGVGDGRIEFNESFRLQVTLKRDMSVKGRDKVIFQKNFIELNLYEPRREKTIKGQLLGTAVLDLAEYGIVKESFCVSTPINCKRTYWSAAQPLLYLKIQSVDRGRTNSCSRSSLTREASVDFESVSVLGEEYAEEAEGASFTTDDDASSHSSLGATSAAAESNGISSPLNKNNGMTGVNGTAGATKTNKEHMSESHVKSKGSSSCSLDLSSDLTQVSKKICSQSFQSSSTEEMEKEQSFSGKNNEHKKEADYIQKNVVNGGRDMKIEPNSEEGILTIGKQSPARVDHQTNEHLGAVLVHWQDDEKASSLGTDDPGNGRTNSPQNGLTGDKTPEIHQMPAEERNIFEEKMQHAEDERLSGLSQVDIKQFTLESDLLSTPKENFDANSNISNIDRSKHVKSVRLLGDSCRSNGSVRRGKFYLAQGSISNECEDDRITAKEARDPLSYTRIQHLEHRMKILEDELREAAAIEASLYSVIAEHGSSMTKVHAPARRLSRFYFHASKQCSKSRRESSAKSIVSGLILVSKACGNDVPRLTFWLSNSIVLRVIMSKFFRGSRLPIAVGPAISTVGDRNDEKPSSPLKWESFPNKGTRSAVEESFGNWENPLTFVAALEKVESWIFSRIIESVWWQTFTPHMQLGNAKEIRSSVDTESNKLIQRASSSTEQQGNFSVDLWKMAFRDATERICPVRAGGHNCGCLPVLSRVIMEQLLARLDVAMFNAILRESADEIPTDPVADPISDAEVLPIPAGKASFSAGAQLKNAIGNWSGWLADLFGMDDDGLLEDKCDSETADDDENMSPDAPPKFFHLLNALSDLMMLPKDLLLSRTVRKEVCPTFGPPLITRVLNSFIPDEFCPDPVPAVVLQALNSEDQFDLEDNLIMNFPCAAAPVVYEPPAAASIASILGEIDSHSELTRSRSSVLKKSQTSDDELDELDSPLKSILDIVQGSPSLVQPGSLSMKNGSRNAFRYQLLRDVWMNSE